MEKNSYYEQLGERLIESIEQKCKELKEDRDKYKQLATIMKIAATELYQAVGQGGSAMFSACNTYLKAMDEYDKQ